MKHTLTAAVIAFCGGVVVGHYLVPGTQPVVERRSARAVSDEQPMSARIAVSPRPRPDPGPAATPSAWLDMPGRSRARAPGRAPSLQEEYAEVLRDLGLSEIEVRERIASFTLPQPVWNNELGPYRFDRPSSSPAELAVELEAALSAMGMPPSEAAPMADAFVENHLLPDTAEERRLEAELEQVVSELRIPGDGVVPAPEETAPDTSP